MAGKPNRVRIAGCVLKFCWLPGLLNRKQNVKGAARELFEVTPFTFYPDTAVVRFNNPLHNGQPQPKTTPLESIFAGGMMFNGAKGVELVKNAPVFAVGNTNTCILNDEINCITNGTAYHKNAATVWCIFYRVTKNMVNGRF